MRGNAPRKRLAIMNDDKKLDGAKIPIEAYHDLDLEIAVEFKAMDLSVLRSNLKEENKSGKMILISTVGDVDNEFKKRFFNNAQ